MLKIVFQLILLAPVAILAQAKTTQAYKVPNGSISIDGHLTERPTRARV
jgi:hypothetical protein